MTGNTFGTALKLTSFGESHGPAIGGIVEGMPAGLSVDMNFVQRELQRRSPGQSDLTTARKEPDEVQFLSGIYEGKTTGTPIGFLIWNQDAKQKDYDHLKKTYRPSHADYTYDVKYGHRDHRGGGRSSARETACRIVAGALAKLLLHEQGVFFAAYVEQIGRIKTEKHYSELDFDLAEQNKVRCPDAAAAQEMEVLIKNAKEQGDTLGGVIFGLVRNVPIGLGEPVFDKLNAELAKAMLSINAVKGFEFGAGFAASQMMGSEHNDQFEKKGQTIATKSNHSGGIQGGISNGEDIYFRVAFKPVATLMQNQQTVNDKGEHVILEGKGRHDPCVLPRAVPIVEAMAALVIGDHWLRHQLNKI